MVQSLSGIFFRNKLLVSKKTLICLTNFPLVKKFVFHIFIPSLIYTIKRYDMSAFYFLILSTLKKKIYTCQTNHPLYFIYAKMYRNVQTTSPRLTSTSPQLLKQNLSKNQYHHRFFLL